MASFRIPAEEYAARRARLMAAMGEGSIALVAAATERVRNHDVHYPFRQDSDFRYLTGFPEPDALAVLRPGHAESYVLFCRPRDPLMEIWHGRRAGPAGAIERFGADAAYPLDELDQRLPELLEGVERVHYRYGADPALDTRVSGWISALRAKLRSGVHVPRELVNLDALLHAHRRVKSPAELEVMRSAGRISAAGHRRAMQVCRPGLNERRLEAEILHEFALAGAGWSYPAIVGGGDNACILHYTENDAELRDGDLVLIDAGCELDSYAGDITRTFPVNGRYSGPQRALYEVVLAAQHAAMAVVRPGMAWPDYHDAAVRVLTEGLISLGLLEGGVDERIADESYRRFYMHRTGHWLGMDVHDPCEYKDGADWTRLEAGMVLTVEPGLYVAPDAEGVDARFRGIGIRIEDDVAVTADGCEVLSAGVPTAIDDIEALMRDA
ncbi:MAG TPA: Xaa-Pro aminopeptidase [Plasticicumulans sp.]|nr:Xaa-Pro aminopeptidase [Plasticicumulans sp.]